MKSSNNIWHAYHNRLAAFIRSKVAEDAVEDLLQDVFLKIHQRIDTLKDNAKLERWLYQLTRNVIVDYYRAQHATQELPEWIEQPQIDTEESIRRELSACLQPMVEQLPVKYRNAIQLSELEAKTQQQVAEMEGISLSGAKSRVQRGRALLKGMLHDCCEFEINQNNQVVAFQRKQKDPNCKIC